MHESPKPADKPESQGKPATAFAPYFAPAQAMTGAALFGTLLDNLAVSLFLAVFLGAFVFWLTPSIVKRSVIEVIEPKQINPLLKVAATGTRSWLYKGACGRYTRATTIPKLAEAARIEGIGRDIGSGSCDSFRASCDAKLLEHDYSNVERR